MMSDMISYSTAMIQAIAEFLGTPPMLYLFGLVCGCFVIKMMLSLITWK